MAELPGQNGNTDVSRPEWLGAFLADRGTRKPSMHTMKAYRQDFDAIATLVAGDADGVSRMSLGDITTDSLRTAFAQYAETHESASIQRCWSTWNVLCTYLYTSELIVANPMPLVDRPKLAKTLPNALPTDSVTALLAAERSRDLAIPGIARFPSRRNGRRPLPRRARPRVAPHLRHRTRQLRCQRLHAHASARPRIHGDFPALRHRGRPRTPHCRSPEQTV